MTRIDPIARCAGSLAIAVALTACGDVATTDDRQFYTKAPLEDPGLTVTPEVPDEMAELGEPNLYGFPDSIRARHEAPESD